MKELQKHWYEVLANEGFEDIEDHNTGLLKTWSSRIRNDFTVEEFEENVTYITLAEQFLTEYIFVNDEERLTWELFSEGYSTRRIASIMKECGHHTNKDRVNKILNRLQRIMLDAYT